MKRLWWWFHYMKFKSKNPWTKLYWNMGMLIHLCPPMSASSHTINHSDPVLTWQCLQCHICDHNTFLFLFFITTVCPLYLNKNRKVDFECHAFRSSVEYGLLCFKIKKTFYLLCNASIAMTKEYNIHQHY